MSIYDSHLLRSIIAEKNCSQSRSFRYRHIAQSQDLLGNNSLQTSHFLGTDAKKKKIKVPTNPHQSASPITNHSPFPHYLKNFPSPPPLTQLFYFHRIVQMTKNKPILRAGNTALANTKPSTMSIVDKGPVVGSTAAEANPSKASGTYYVPEAHVHGASTAGSSHAGSSPAGTAPFIFSPVNVAPAKCRPVMAAPVMATPVMAAPVNATPINAAPADGSLANEVSANRATTCPCLPQYVFETRPHEHCVCPRKDPRKGLDDSDDKSELASSRAPVLTPTFAPTPPYSVLSLGDNAARRPLFGGHGLGYWGQFRSLPKREPDRGTEKERKESQMLPVRIPGSTLHHDGVRERAFRMCGIDRLNPEPISKRESCQATEKEGKEPRMLPMHIPGTTLDIDDAVPDGDFRLWDLPRLFPGPISKQESGRATEKEGKEPCISTRASTLPPVLPFDTAKHHPILHPMFQSYGLEHATQEPIPNQEPGRATENEGKEPSMPVHNPASTCAPASSHMSSMVEATIQSHICAYHAQLNKEPVPNQEPSHATENEKEKSSLPAASNDRWLRPDKALSSQIAAYLNGETDVLPPGFCTSTPRPKLDKELEDKVVSWAVYMVKEWNAGKAAAPVEPQRF